MQTLTTSELIGKRFIGTDDLRRELTSILDKLPKEGGDLVVTQHGKPQAVLLSLASYLDLIETIEDLSTPGFIESIHQAAQEVKEGKGLTHEELKKSLGL